MKLKQSAHQHPNWSSRRFRVGVRLPEWATGFAFRLFEGLLEFQRTGAPVELHFNHPGGGDLPPAPVDKHWEGDGLLVYRYTREEARAWKARGIAVVNLSAEVPGLRPDFPRITVDNRLVGRLAAEHLSALGLFDFAFIHDPDRRYSTERLESFREAVSEAGGRLHQIDVPASRFDLSKRPQRIEKCCRGPLASLPRPCGILAKDDISATWTLRLLHKLGINCPDEMPVLGVDDDLVYCHTVNPPLSSIPYPARKIGYAAAELLRRMMSGESVPASHRLLLPPRPVVARESTRQVVLADEVVTRALEMIRHELLRRSVSVDELSRAMGVSRENLRQRFQPSLGRSPKREIERLRCHHVSELLRGSKRTLDSIAEECGFSGPDDVCRFIKRLTGKTPGTIRREEAR